MHLKILCQYSTKVEARARLKREATEPYGQLASTQPFIQSQGSRTRDEKGAGAPSCQPGLLQPHPRGSYTSPSPSPSVPTNSGDISSEEFEDDTMTRAQKKAHRKN